MRKLIVACWVLVSGACSDPDDPAPTQANEAIFELDFRSSMIRVRDCRLSPAEHDGFYIEVYASRRAASAYTEGNYPFDSGTLLVKGEYDDEQCKKLARVSAMKRLSDGEAPDLHDWQWQRTDPEGVVLEETAARSCAGCHSACQESDFACTDP